MKKQEYNSSMPDINEFISVKEAEELSGLTAAWIRQLCAKGKIDSHRFGKDRNSEYVVHRASLLAYVEERREAMAEKYNLKK